MFIDLSHEFYDGMPGFKYKNEDGTVTRFRVEIHPFLTHAQTAPRYQNRAAFEITEMKFHTSMGTYLDAPYHRFPEKCAIGELRLDQVILDGIVIDARGMDEREAKTEIPNGIDLRGKAVLFHFGWDKFWETEKYEAYPFLARGVIDELIVRGAKLVGVDTMNIDDTRDPERPAHTRLLQNDILIVENLCGLDVLHGKQFRFFAVPIKARNAAAMPVRAFAEIVD